MGWQGIVPSGENVSMIYFHSTSDFYIAGSSAVTLGKFDGVHKGHQLLMHRIHDLEKEGCVSVAFTIEAGRGPFLLTAQEQKEAIEGMGIQVMVRCPFLPEFAGMSPEQFIDEILLQRLHAKYVVVGTDYRFGHHRRGDANFLREYGKTHGFETFIIDKALYEGREISSSFIREELLEGNLEAVNAMLGNAFPVEGIVMHGAHLGTQLGMPTINLVPDPVKLLPPNGVYYSVTEIDGKRINGITNVGTKPTVDGKYMGVETYLYDFDQDIYGQKVCTRLLKHVRAEKRFDGTEQLKEQIKKDIEAGRKYFL